MKTTVVGTVSFVTHRVRLISRAITAMQHPRMKGGKEVTDNKASRKQYPKAQPGKHAAPAKKASKATGGGKSPKKGQSKSTKRMK